MEIYTKGGRGGETLRNSVSGVEDMGLRLH
jgi:hypothetical protein